MGYPMSFRRILDRNNLHDGDYGNPPLRWNQGIAGPVTVLVDDAEGLMKVLLVEQEKLRNLMSKLSLLAGDIRRFKHDAVDEDYICKYIADELHLDEETVAMVIRKFMEI